ncbi:MAG TPA: hypothetical protein VIA18_32365 [Polyangia bacterium]|jgi:hypothetical protein|nr:hypothetical protein [Polyangia bacterium]
MKYALLGGSVVACALLALLASLTFSPPLAEFLCAASYGLASVMGLLNAANYGRHDRLRWAWLCFGLGYLFGFASAVAFGTRPDAERMTTLAVTLWNLCVLFLNVFLVASEAWFARMWSNTGLAPPGRLGATIVFLALALLFDGKAALHDIGLLAHGNVRALSDLTSLTTDIISIGLVGPIFATVIALRGGLLVRPWIFLFLSSFAWLLDDATVLLPHHAAAADLFTRVLAVQFAFAAAMAQRLVRADLSAAMAKDLPPLD